MPRLFVAVPLPPELKAGLARAQHQLRDTGLPLRLSHPESLHVTLAFLGERPAESLEQLRDAVLSVGRTCGPFECRCAGLGAFPSPRRARVVWAGLDHVGNWAILHRKLVRALNEADERFQPHITLARMRGRPENINELARSLQRQNWGRLPVDRIVLYQSELKPEGARHTPLVQARLTGPTV